LLVCHASCVYALGEGTPSILAGPLMRWVHGDAHDQTAGAADSLRLMERSRDRRGVRPSAPGPEAADHDRRYPERAGSRCRAIPCGADPGIAGEAGELLEARFLFRPGV